VANHHATLSKIPHTISEELLLPAAIDLAITVIGKGDAEQLKKVPLSHDLI